VPPAVCPAIYSVGYP